MSSIILKDHIVTSTVIHASLSVFIFQNIIWAFGFLLSILITIPGNVIWSTTLEAAIFLCILFALSKLTPQF